MSDLPRRCFEDNREEGWKDGRSIRFETAVPSVLRVLSRAGVQNKGDTHSFFSGFSAARLFTFLILAMLPSGCVPLVGEDPESNREAAGVDKSEASNAGQLARQYIADLSDPAFAKRQKAFFTLLDIGQTMLNADRYHEDADFDRCFAVPLFRASQSQDEDVRKRAKQVYDRFCPPRPVGDGIGGQALYSLFYQMENMVDSPLKRKLFYDPPRNLPDAEREQLTRHNTELLNLIGRVRAAAMANMVRTHPKETMDWIAGFPEIVAARHPRAVPELNCSTSSFVNALAHYHFDRAWKWAKNIEDGYLKWGITLKCIQKWPSNRDLDDARKTLEEIALTDFGERERIVLGTELRMAFASLTRRMADMDPDSAIRYLNNFPVADLRNGGAIGSTVATANPDRAIQLADTVVIDARDSYLSAVVAVLLKNNHPISNELVDMFSTDRKAAARSNQLAQIAFSSPKAAFLKLHALPPPYQRIGAEQAARSLGSQQKRLPECVLNELTVEARDTYYLAVITRLAAVDWKAAKKLADSALQSQHQRNAALANLAVELLKTDPKKSFHLVDSEVTDKWLREVTRDRLFTEWAALDPNALSAWLLENSTQFDSPRFCVLTRQWGKRDSSSAFSFAQRTTDGEAKCFALLGVAECEILTD